MRRLVWTRKSFEPSLRERGARARRRAPRCRESSARLEGVVKAVVRDLLPELDSGLTGPAVMESAPKSRVDDLLAELICRVEVVHGVQVSGRSGGVEAVDVEVDLVGA